MAAIVTSAAMTSAASRARRTLQARLTLSQISAAQAVGLINKGAKIVDVREQEPYDKAHIVGAIRVAPDQLEVDRRLKKNKPVILVCDNGISSGRFIDNLREAGFESVFSLQGGLMAWQRDNLPVVSRQDS